MHEKFYAVLALVLLFCAVCVGNPFLPDREVAAGERTAPGGSKPAELVGAGHDSQQPAVPPFVQVGGVVHRVASVAQSGESQVLLLEDGRAVRRVATGAKGATGAEGRTRFEFVTEPLDSQSVGPASAVPAALPVVVRKP